MNSSVLHLDVKLRSCTTLTMWSDQSYHTHNTLTPKSESTKLDKHLFWRLVWLSKAWFYKQLLTFTDHIFYFLFFALKNWKSSPNFHFFITLLGIRRLPDPSKHFFLNCLPFKLHNYATCLWAVSPIINKYSRCLFEGGKQNYDKTENKLPSSCTPTPYTDNAFKSHAVYSFNYEIFTKLIFLLKNCNILISIY